MAEDTSLLSVVCALMYSMGLGKERGLVGMQEVEQDQEREVEIGKREGQ